MSTTEAFRTAQDRWLSAKPRITALIDWAAFMYHWLARNRKLVAVNLFALPVLGLIYWTINSIGLRLTVSGFTTKLYRIPGLSALRHYHGGRDLDLANVAALGMLILVWIFTVLTMHIFMRGGFHFSTLNERFVNGFVVAAGLVLLIADATMFTFGVAEQSSYLRSASLSLPQIILAVTYATALLCVAFLHVLSENHND